MSFDVMGMPTPKLEITLLKCPETGNFMAYTASGIFGIGETVADALAEFESMLRDMYQELTNSDMPLTNYLFDQLQLLRAFYD